MWTKYSSAPCTESPETNQIVSGTVLERLFYRALDAKGNVIFCIKSSLMLNTYLEFSLKCACCIRHVNIAAPFGNIDSEALSDCINHWHNFSEKLPPGYDIQLGLTLSKDSG